MSSAWHVFFLPNEFVKISQTARSSTTRYNISTKERKKIANIIILKIIHGDSVNEMARIL